MPRNDGLKMIIVAPDGDDISRLRALLEHFGNAEMSSIIFDPERLTDTGIAEIEQLRELNWTKKLAIVPVPREYLERLFIPLAPDQRARYDDGFPVLIAPVFREDRDPNSQHRPVDNPVVAAAKNALKVEAFRLAGQQTAVELARKTRQRDLTFSGARDRARVLLAKAIWRGGADPHDEGKKLRLAGLIDRGRRIAAKFFGTKLPSDQLRIEARDVAERLRTHGPDILSVIEADTRDRARGMSWNEERAKTFSHAMSQWNAAARANGPIESVDAIDVTNAIATRMDAPALMKVAIAGGFDPTSVHKNYLFERPRFELGVLLGELSRKRPIEMTPKHAAVLEAAIATVRRRRFETHADHCDWLLVEAAERCGLPEFWEPLVDRIVASGIPETIEITV
jgi:hypothetical protein